MNPLLNMDRELPEPYAEPLCHDQAAFLVFLGLPVPLAPAVAPPPE